MSISAVLPIESSSSDPIQPISASALAAYLAIPDLTDPASGPHAIQQLISDITEVLCHAWHADLLVYRGSRVVDVADNYDALGYDPAAVTRASRYSHYTSPTTMLRSHTSAGIPKALQLLAEHQPDDVLVACPGMVYRRDVIDRLHTGYPHQLDLWRVTKRDLTTEDLEQLISVLVTTLLPGADYRVTPAVHPYTTNGLQIDVDNGGEWVEIGECGLASQRVLDAAGVVGTGLALGMGLDRLLMLRKGVADIRLLRSTDLRVMSQMQHLGLYNPVSTRPAIVRDLSLAMDAVPDEELLGDRVRDLLGADAVAVEEVAVVATCPAPELPGPAAARLGIGPNQVNVLLRVTLRHPDQTLTRGQANSVRDRVYAGLHAPQLPVLEPAM